MKNKEDKRIEEMKNPQKKETKYKTKYISSMILPDETIVEMILNKKEKKTSLVLFKGGSLKTRRSTKIGKNIFKPYPADKNFLINDVILFPSTPMEYKNQKELIQEIQIFINKYLVVSDFFEKICVYYILFSWIYDDFRELPYLRGLGDYGTGKSRFLKVVGSICYHPIFTSGATTVSPIFRMLNDFRGTLILDEADLKLSDATIEMVKILNCGFTKGTPVIRSESNGKGFDVKSFNVFSPKIIASRKLFDDSALESRMITEDMNQSVPRKNTPYNIPDEFDEEALVIRNKLLTFRFHNKGRFKLKTQYEDRTIEPRLNQIAVPIMSIIDDESTVIEMQKYIREYNEVIKADRTLDYNYQILEAVTTLLDNGHEEPTVGQVTSQFNKDLEISEEITSRKMGYLLKKDLNLKTQKTREGYIVSRENKKKITTLRKRFGIEPITSNENNVNDVNIAKEGKQEKIL